MLRLNVQLVMHFQFRRRGEFFPAQSTYVGDVSGRGAGPTRTFARLLLLVMMLLLLLLKVRSHGGGGGDRGCRVDVGWDSRRRRQRQQLLLLLLLLRRSELLMLLLRGGCGSS